MVLPSTFHPLAPSVGSLENYIYYVNQLPLLTLEEEQHLTAQFFHFQDREAARKLILSHLRCVVRIAKRYLGYGLALGDLIQEGNIGLMKAIERFDPHKGVRVVTFAIHWIKAEIHEFILRHWRIVKMATTKAQRKLFFNLHRAKKRLGWFTPEEAKTVAEDLGVKPKEIYEMEARLNAHDIAVEFTEEEGNETAGNKRALIPYLIDERYDPALECENQDLAVQKQALQRSLLELDERSRDIVQQRWLNHPQATLQALANRYGLSIERIRQLEQKAMAQLRKNVASLI